MGSSIIKKMRIGAVVVVMLYTLILVGCQNREHKSERFNQSETKLENNEGETSYQSSCIQLSDKYSLGQLSNEYIYVCSDIRTEGISIQKLSKINGELIENYDIGIYKDMYLHNIAIDSKENMYLMLCNYLVNSNTATILTKHNNEGNFKSYNVVFEDLYPETYTEFKELVPGENGEIYVWIETSVPITEAGLSQEQLSNYDLSLNGYCTVNRVYVFSAEMQLDFYVQVASLQGERLEGIFLDSTKKLSVVISDKEGVKTKRININTNKLENEIRITTRQYKNMDFVEAIKGGFVFCHDRILYEYNRETNLIQDVFKWSDFGVDPNNVMCTFINEDTIEIMDNYQYSDNSELVILSKGNEKKTVLTLGVLQVTPNLQNIVTLYNRYSKDCRIKIIPYVDEREDFEKGINELRLDIITGNGPDIIDTSMIDKSVYTTKEAFVDLITYLQNDVSVNQQNIIGGVLKSCLKDGHLYSISPSVQIYSVWGKKTILGDQYGIALTEFMKLLEKHDKNLNAIDGFYADETVLTTLCNFCMDNFIDWKNKECKFDCTLFKSVMQFSKMYTGGYVEASRSEGIKNNDIIMTIGIISDVSDYQIQKALFDDELSFIGYPVERGSGTALGFVNEQLAINQASNDKDKAWDFIKYYVQNGYDGRGFPILENMFYEEMEKAQKVQYITTMDNNVIEVPSKVYVDSDISIEVFEASQEDCKAIMDIIMRADSLYEYNTDIINIINEEADSYFRNDKNIDDVIKIIESRVGLYLSE